MNFNKYTIAFLIFFMMSCNQSVINDDKQGAIIKKSIQNYLNFKFNDTVSIAYEIKIYRNLDMIFPFKYFAKLKTDYSEYVKLTDHFNLIPIDSIKKHEEYIKSDKYYFKQFPFLAYTDSMMYFDVKKKMESEELNWWDIKETDTDTMLVGFINVHNENSISLINDNCSQSNCDYGKFICQYKNGYTYIFIASL